MDIKDFWCRGGGSLLKTLGFRKLNFDASTPGDRQHFCKTPQESCAYLGQRAGRYMISSNVNSKKKERLMVERLRRPSLPKYQSRSPMPCYIPDISSSSSLNKLSTNESLPSRLFSGSRLTSIVVSSSSSSPSSTFILPPLSSSSSISDVSTDDRRVSFMSSASGVGRIVLSFSSSRSSILGFPCRSSSSSRVVLSSTGVLAFLPFGAFSARPLTIFPKLTWILYKAFRPVASDMTLLSTAADTSA